MKRKLLKTFLLAVGLLVGGSAWADKTYMTTMTGPLGLTNNSAPAWTYYSKTVTIKAGETYTYNFQNYTKGSSAQAEWETWIAEVREKTTDYCLDARGDGGGWKWESNSNNLSYNYTGKAWNDGGRTLSDFMTAYNDVTVTLTISCSNDGKEVTIARTATLNDGTTDYSGTWTCSNFAGNDKTINLIAEASHQNITKVSYTNASGVVTNWELKNVDLSQFDTYFSGSYSDGVATFTNSGSSKVWAKLSLSSYFSGITGTITNVNMKFTENMNNGGRMAIGIYGNDKGSWATNAYPDTGNSVSAWGLTGNDSYTKIYYNDGTEEKNTTGVTLNSTTEIEVDMDVVNKKFTWIQGSTTKVNNQNYCTSDVSLPQYLALYSWSATNTTTLTNMTMEVVYVSYTATLTETNSLNPTITIYTDADRTNTISNGSLSDKTTYYYRAVLYRYQNYEGSFTVDGANPSVSFTMEADEPVNSLNVYARISGNDYLIKTISLDNKYVGDQVTFCYPRLWLVGTTLYETAQEAHTSKEYYKWSNYTLTGNSVEIEYNTTFATNVVYFSEGENITGMTADASGNADIRCSDGQGGRSAEELSLTSLGVGQYKLGSRVWGNTGVSYTYKAAGGEILTHALTGALDDKIVCFNVVSGTAAITVQGSTDTGSKVLDYVYIQKLGEEDGLIYNGNFDNSTWDKGWNGTGTTKSEEFVKQNTSQPWANDNFAEMWTDGSFSAEANLNQILVNVPAGSYTLSANILNNVTLSGGVLYAKVGSAPDVTAAAENGSGSHESVSFTVPEKSNVIVGFKTTDINTKKGWIAMDNFELEQTAVSAAITSAGWATFSSAYDLDFSTPITGLTAYKAVSCDGNTVTLEEVTGKVKAGDGLVIKGAQGTYPIPVTTDASTVYTDSENINMWGYNGNATETVGKATTGTHYVLSIQSGNVVFAPIGDVSATLNPGQAALWVKNFGGARVLNIVFADEATGIKSIENGQLTIDNYFDLQGRRVAQPTKGLYIVNGKKVIMK